jgi:hypothetical protein
LNKQIIGIIMLIICKLGFAQSGSGTSGDPYIITTPQQFSDIRETGLFSTAGIRYYQLANNLDFSEFGDFNEFPPLQNNAGISIEGMGYTISNMTLEGTIGSNDRFGLFQYLIACTLKLKNITFDNIQVNKTQSSFRNGDMGLIAGLTSSSTVYEIENIIIQNSGFNLTETADGGRSCGIFIGVLKGEGYIRNLTIQNCSFIGVTTGNNEGAAWTVGNIAGVADFDENEMVLTEITSYNNYIYIENHDNPSNGARVYVGAILGRNNDGRLTNFYSLDNTVIGTLTSSTSSTSVGGLVGVSSNSSSHEFTYENGYVANNTLSSSSASVGSLIGLLQGFSNVINILDCYYDESVTNAYGTSSGTNLGTKEPVLKTSEELKDIATYVGWDFDEVWGISEYEQDGYPYLLGNILLVLNSPNTGDYYIIPNTVPITWVGKAGSNPEVDIEYSTNGGTNWTSLATGVTSPYNWDFSSLGINTDFAKVKIILDGYEAESGNFSIRAQDKYIIIQSPLSLNQIIVGSPVNIQLEAFNIDSVRLEWSSNQTNWNVITSGIEAGEGLTNPSYNWTIPSGITSPFWLKAVEDGDTVIYVYNKELTRIGTTMPPNPQICWHGHEDRPVQSYLSYDQGCGWVNGLNHTLVITEIIDDGTYSRTFITCDGVCGDEAGANIDMTFVTVGAQQYTINQFYTFGQSVTYKGRKYYTGSATLWMDDLINDIDSIFVADLSPYIDNFDGSYHTGWIGTPSLLQLYHVQKGKIRGNTYPPDQVFEDLNDSWFKPKILIGGSYFGHGGLLVYSIDALPAPNTLTPEEDIVELSGGVYRNYFRGIVPRAITNIELQPGQ